MLSVSQTLSPPPNLRETPVAGRLDLLLQSAPLRGERFSAGRLNCLWSEGSGFGRVLLLLLVVLIWGLSPAVAHAQFQPVTGGGEVTMTARPFGVGGIARPGEWTGIRLLISDIGDRQRDVLVRISMPDPDGDRILYERTLTTNPGITQPLWIYLRLPSRFGGADSLQVTAFAAVEQAVSGAAGDSRWTFAAGQPLGSARIGPNRIINPTASALGIVGSRPMGLMRYMGLATGGGASLDYLPTGHERTEIVQRLEPDMLPDRWFGLSQFETLVWNEPPPAALGTERGQALREWVMRGGHLIVVLPRLGQAWTDEVNNPIHDIMPRATVHRLEGVNLAPYLPMITKRTDTIMPRNEIVHVFTPVEGASIGEAIAVLRGPPDSGNEGDTEGPIIVMRRLVGTGMVTLVGLDVASRWMTENGLPDAELFWHRILGRRGELPSGREQDGLTNPIHISRDQVTLDRDLGDQIAKTGRAAAGVLIGFVVFIAYWLVAGPVGYAVLRRKGAARHGWMAFVAAAVLFTGIAWGGATIIKPQRIEGTHLTFLDHVYGQPMQRTRTWVSVLVPDYGEAAVSLGDPAARTPDRFQNVIAPWEPVGAGRQGFPDARDYRVESRSPDHIVVPVRATVKQFQMDWAGGPRWSMPRPVGDPAGTEPRISLTRRGPNEWRIDGTLIHDLPATMKNVTIVLVTGQKNFAGALHVGGSQALLSHVFSVRIPEWQANAPLDLGGLFSDLSAVPRNPAYGEAFFKDLLENAGRIDSQEMLDADAGVNRLTALALYSQLAPPETRAQPGFVGRGQRLALRRSSHGWDLGNWFTQPSLIIIGHVGDSGQGAPTPTPIFVSMQGGVSGLTGGGQSREIPTSGRTVVRWVYPLGSAPPEGLTSRDAEVQQTPEPREGTGR